MLRRAGRVMAVGLSIGALLAAEAGGQDAPSAATLLDRAFLNLYGEDYIQTLELATRARGGREMSRRLQIVRKRSVEPGKALVRFLAPYEVRRTAVLILENRDASDDIYVYLPALRRTRHLSGAQRADAFFGTDLSYEDIEPKVARDYEARFAGTGALGETPCRRVDFRARRGIDSSYERMVSCIDSERAVILWTDFYRGGAVVKRLEVEPGAVRAIGERHIPFDMTVATPGRQSRTRVVTESYELRPAIPEQLFSTWNLEAGDADRDRSRSAGPRAR